MTPIRAGPEDSAARARITAAASSVRVPAGTLPAASAASSGAGAAVIVSRRHPPRARVSAPRVVANQAVRSHPRRAGHTDHRTSATPFS